MSEAALLRTLADKLDLLEAVSTYPTDVTHPGNLTVTWSEQSDHAGYDALSQAVSELVAQHWNALRSQVLKQRESEVQAARSALVNGAATPADKPQPAPAANNSVEAALRKVAG